MSKRLHAVRNLEILLTAASFLLFLASPAYTAVSRAGSGVGADCLLFGTPGDLAPVYGRCRSLSGALGQVSFRAIEAPETLDEELKWIILWSSPADAQQLSADACREAESSTHPSFNGSCSVIFSSVIPGVAVTLSKPNLLSFLLKYNSSVASVHEDTVVSALDFQQDPPWSLDRLDQIKLPLDEEYHYYNLATGVNAYIIDTGIRTTHTEFRYMDGRPGSRASEVYTSLTSGEVGQDCNGHGTHVAGTVGGLTYGPAKNVTLLAVRSLECRGNGTVSQVIDGLDWVQANHRPPAVAVMALGGDAQYALDLAVHNLVAAGVAVMVAAGNEDTDACTKSPARELLATTVAATDRDDERLWISPGTASNYGSCVKIWAPGTDIQSASTVSDTATEFRSGTSQAAPFVAGVIALHLQNNTDATPSDLNNALAAWGSWGQVTEASASSPNGTKVLNGTVNLLLNPLQSAPTALNPYLFTLQPGSLGPFNASVSLGQALTSNLTMAVSLSNPSRGVVAPSQLTFTSSNWAVPQQISLQLWDAALKTPDSSTFNVNFLLNSDSLSLHGQTMRGWVFDQKGGDFSYPKVVLQLPFRDSSTTYFADNTYALNCGGCANCIGRGRDIVYFFQPTTDCSVTISLCSSRNTSEPFDTLLYVIGDLLTTTIMGLDCNDDFCGQQSQLTLAMSAGVGYGIIVDGKYGQFGTYTIDVTADQGNVTGKLPPLSYTQQIQRTIPPTMLAAVTLSGAQSYTILQVSSGSSPVPPFPPPPPSPSIGTVAGPPAPSKLPPVFGSTGAPITSNVSGSQVVTSSSGVTPSGSPPSPPSSDVRQVTGPTPSPPPAPGSSSSPPPSPGSTSSPPAQYEVRKITGPTPPFPPPYTAPGPQFVTKTMP